MVKKMMRVDHKQIKKVFADYAKKHKINVFYQNFGTPCADTKTRSIVIPEPWSRPNVLIGLHEFGHLIHPLGHPKRHNDDLVRIGCTTKRTLIAELAAWNWAISRFNDDLDAGDRKYIGDVMNAYWKMVQHKLNLFELWYVSRFMRKHDIDFMTSEVKVYARYASGQYTHSSQPQDQRSTVPSREDWDSEYEKDLFEIAELEQEMNQHRLFDNQE